MDVTNDATLNQFGALVLEAESFMTKDDLTPILENLGTVIHRKPNMMRELTIYRTQLPKLIEYLLQSQRIMNGFCTLYQRILTDSEDKKGQRWCAEEDEYLIELVCEGASMLDISTTLGRTPASIKTRLSRLVGLKRLSQEVVGHFIGHIDGTQTECSINGTVYKERR